MKKIILFAAGGAILVLLSAVFVLTNKNDSEISEAAKIEKDYISLCEKLEKQQREGMEIDFADDYAQLFTRISKGNPADAKEYAQLIRTMTNDYIKFEDEEVFSIAEYLAELYKKLSDGFDDFGVQQIKIAENSSGKYSLVVDYFDDKFGAYSVRKMDKDEKVYYLEQLIEYDGLLGENRIEIIFYGAKASDELIKMYPLGISHKLKGASTELNIKIAANPPGLGGLIVHIGSNEPINIKEQGHTSINLPMGTIEIEIDK